MKQDVSNNMEISKTLRILVVDDSPSILMVAKKIFSKLGFSRIKTAEDGEQALSMLNSGIYDLVIADMNMPKMTGIDLLNEMKKEDHLKDIPFLLVTAEERQDEILEAIKAGVNNYMPKPWDVITLMEKIERIFEFQEELRNRPIT